MKLIDAKALKQKLSSGQMLPSLDHGDVMWNAALSAAIESIDSLPDAGCARATSSVSQYCPIAEEAGREVEGLREKVAELEAAYFVLECCKEAEQARANAAETRIRELEAAAEAGRGGEEMTTRERIEAEIERLEKCRDVYMAYEAAFDAYNEGIGALESILADLPAETPPTLEEFQENGEWFLCRPIGTDEIRVLAFGETETEYGECRIALMDQDDNVWDVDIQDGFEMKRICDSQWYPVEGE